MNQEMDALALDISQRLNDERRWDWEVHRINGNGRTKSSLHEPYEIGYGLVQ